jgi:hypothetical protein
MLYETLNSRPARESLTFLQAALVFNVLVRQGCVSVDLLSLNASLFKPRMIHERIYNIGIMKEVWRSKRADPSCPPQLPYRLLLEQNQELCG